MQAATLPCSGANVEHELKFAVPAIRADSLAEWLRMRCVRDPLYPDGLVTSIYFDNRSLTSLRAKINSDFIKRKVRVRWYADSATGAPHGQAYAEIKEKVGARRFKVRIPLDVAATEMAGATSASIARDLLEPLREAGHWVETDLQPLLRVTFRRRRFTDPMNGARIAIDQNIRGTIADLPLLPASRPAALRHAVIEVKGAHRELSKWLTPMRRFGCRRESFSKYERCYQKLTGGDRR